VFVYKLATKEFNFAGQYKASYIHPLSLAIPHQARSWRRRNMDMIVAY